MKVFDANDTSIRFELSEREYEALLSILGTYPVVPPGHRSVTRRAPIHRVPFDLSRCVGGS